MPIPTPTAHGLTAESAPYLGFAKQQLPAFKRYMELGGLKIGSKRIVLANGVVIMLNVCYSYENISISVPPSVEVTTEIVEETIIRGFITHPRNGVVRGFQFPGHDSARTPTYGIAHTGIGYSEDEDGNIIDDGDYAGAQEGLAYPLIDEDEKERHWLFSNDEGWEAEGPQQLMYGNVDWKGPAGEDRKILTYKGNPSRYWPVGQFVEIPGLSSVDHSVEGMLNSYEYMTVFGDKVYEGGQVLATMPWLYHPLNSVDGGWEANHQNAQVLGAAYRESDGVLICIVKTCYNSYPHVKTVPPAEGSMVSTWQVWKDGLLIQDWYENKDGAEKFIEENPGHNLVEVPDPGRGYWIEVILQKAGEIQGGWKRALRVSTSSAWANCNFFFSEDGTKACSVMFGALHKIVIDGDTATHSTESLGGFKQAIKTEMTNQESEYNPGEAAYPGSPPGSAAAYIRTGLDYHQWFEMNDYTKVYTGVKSGTTTLAADYKGNELVKLNATISGTDTFSKRTLRGQRWTQTALLSSISPRSWVDPWSFMIGEPAAHQNMNGPGSIIYPSLGQFACKPKCTVTTENMLIETAPSRGGNGCDGVYRIANGCVSSGGLARACITTIMQAANGTSSRTDCVLFAGAGEWVGFPESYPWCPFDCCYWYFPDGESGLGDGTRRHCYHACSPYWTPESADYYDAAFLAMGFSKGGDNSYFICYTETYVCP
jgi:hypothetical protein